MTLDPDFDPIGKVYPTVEEIDQRLIRWQDRGFVAETISAALDVAAGLPVPGEVAGRVETQWIGGMIRRGGTHPRCSATSLGAGEMTPTMSLWARPSSRCRDWSPTTCSRAGANAGNIRTRLAKRAHPVPVSGETTPNTWARSSFEVESSGQESAARRPLASGGCQAGNAWRMVGPA